MVVDPFLKPNSPVADVSADEIEAEAFKRDVEGCCESEVVVMAAGDSHSG